MSTPNLTPLQLQVLDLVSRGRTNLAIGAVLDRSEDSVKWQLRLAMRALGADDRAHAVRIGFETGLLRAGRPTRLAAGATA